ncbi:MAG: AtpZ/AtpI family protein [Alphaproteobacteria bacterium]|nr:AtpZ/AtpI family protein [Alphaproteobacteria bacterium]
MIDPDAIRRGAAAAALVTQMAVITVLGGWIGRQLDSWLDTGTALQLSGFVAGFVLGMIPLLTTLTRQPPDDDQQPPDPPQ